MLRRLSLLLALSVSTSCAKTEFVRQMPGPERVLDRRVVEDRAVGPMVLELVDDGALPSGTISGRVYRDTTCTAVREVEAERTVTTKQRSKGGIANVVGGVLLSAAGIGILAAAQRQSDRPKGDDELSPKDSTTVIGTMVLVPGLGLTAWGTTSLIRSRDKKEEIHYTRQDGEPEVSVCERSPVAEAEVILTGEELGIARSVVTRTDGEGAFSVNLLELLAVEVPAITSTGEQVAAATSGLLFPLAPEGKLHVIVDGPSSSAVEQLDAPAWFVSPMAQIMEACAPPSTTRRCDETYAQLVKQHETRPGSFARFPAALEFYKGNVLGRYTGGYKSGKRHGRGKLKFDDGRFYEGQFSDGYRHGKGRSSEPAGTGYQGEFRRGQFHGKGTLFAEDGTTFTGSFREGQPDGHFVEQHPNGFTFAGKMKGSRRVEGVAATLTFPTGHRWKGKYNAELTGGQWSFLNPKKRSPDELYVLAGRHIDQDEIFEARLILRYIADEHPRSSAATRAVDRLAELKAQERAEERFAQQLQAEQQAEREARESQREGERASCLAACSGLEGDGKLFTLYTPYGNCVDRCERI